MKSTAPDALEDLIGQVAGEMTDVRGVDIRARVLERIDQLDGRTGFGTWPRIATAGVLAAAVLVAIWMPRVQPPAPAPIERTVRVDPQPASAVTPSATGSASAVARRIRTVPAISPDEAAWLARAVPGLAPVAPIAVEAIQPSAPAIAPIIVEPFGPQTIDVATIDSRASGGR